MSGLVRATEYGLYCPAGDFHIDPAQPVPRAVITHAHGDHARRGMGHYWATKAGAGLMRARVGHTAPMTLLDYGESFSLGKASVSLHPAGHVLGSAQVRIEVGGEVWVVSGDYKRCPDPSCEPFEPVRCDTFVTEASFAKPEYQWQPPGEVIAELLHWWQQCKARGQTAVLFCYALGKAQRVLAELAAHTDETILLHNAMTPLVKVYRSAGVRMARTEPVGTPPRGQSFAGRLILAPPGAKGTPWLQRFAPYSTGFASGWMRQAEHGRHAIYDHGFALSDHADWPGLLLSIEQTGARQVRTMHGDSAMLLAHLRVQGLNASDLAAAIP